MKIQDIVFFVIVILLIVKPKPKIAAILGLASIIISVPLFYLHIFFTAQRLTMYAAGFFLIEVIIQSLKLKTKSY